MDKLWIMGITEGLFEKNNVDNFVLYTEKETYPQKMLITCIKDVDKAIIICE